MGGVARSISSLTGSGDIDGCCCCCDCVCTSDCGCAFGCACTFGCGSAFGCGCAVKTGSARRLTGLASIAQQPCRLPAHSERSLRNRPCRPEHQRRESHQRRQLNFFRKYRNAVRLRFRYDLRLDGLRARVELLAVGFQSSLQALKFGALRLCVGFELPQLRLFRRVRHDTRLYVGEALLDAVFAALRDLGFLYRDCRRF